MKQSKQLSDMQEYHSFQSKDCIKITWYSACKQTRTSLFHIYRLLFNRYKPQGWWPVIKDGRAVYGLEAPKNDKEIYEIILGTILTQNTSWKNVVKALANLEKSKNLSIEKINKMNIKKLEELIKPSGFYRQKAQRIKEISSFILSFGSVKNFVKKMTREELLKQKGIGPETADSMLLYACKKPEFVVDAYTKRIFSRIGIVENGASYDEIKELFEANCPKDVEIFNEYHALIVEHAKQFCQKKPMCQECPLSKLCKKML